MGIGILGQRQELLRDANSQSCQTLTPISRDSFPIDEPFFTPTKAENSTPIKLLKNKYNSNKQENYQQPDQRNSRERSI